MDPVGEEEEEEVVVQGCQEDEVVVVAVGRVGGIMITTTEIGTPGGAATGEATMADMGGTRGAGGTTITLGTRLTPSSTMWWTTNVMLALTRHKMWSSTMRAAGMASRMKTCSRH